MCRISLASGAPPQEDILEADYNNHLVHRFRRSPTVQPSLREAVPGRYWTSKPLCQAANFNLGLSPALDAKRTSISKLN